MTSSQLYGGIFAVVMLLGGAAWHGIKVLLGWRREARLRQRRVRSVVAMRGARLRCWRHGLRQRPGR